MDTTKSLTNTLRRKALTNCVEILQPCIQALRSIDEVMLERQINAIAECLRNCEKALALVESNNSELQDILQSCTKSCKACMTVCREIDIDLFKKAMTALKDCVVELNSETNPVNKPRKLVR